MSDKMIGLLASELKKEPQEIIELVKKMIDDGEKFSFKIVDLKSITKIEPSDETKIRERLKNLDVDEKSKEKIVTKDGKKIKVRAKKEQDLKNEVEETKEDKKYERELKVDINEKINDKKIINENNTTHSEEQYKEQEMKEVIIEHKKESVITQENLVNTETEEIKIERTVTKQEEMNQKVEKIQTEEVKKDFHKNQNSNNQNNQTTNTQNSNTQNESNKNEKRDDFKNKKDDFRNRNYNNNGNNNNNNKSNSEKIIDKETIASLEAAQLPNKENRKALKMSKKKIIDIKDIDSDSTDKKIDKKLLPKSVVKVKETEAEIEAKKKKATKNEAKKLQKNKILVYNVTDIAEDEEGSVERRKEKKVKKEFKKTEITVPKASKRVIKVEGNSISVAQLANEMDLKSAKVIQELFKQGMAVTVNQYVDIDIATIVANEFGYEIKQVAFDVDAVLKSSHQTSELGIEYTHRAPIVTVMGHVDHGKTKLLDAIRKTNVIDTEAGGITQHIGAYSVDTPKGKITFLDTPGHEAFTAMRARGANITDIVILVVAADDGIMPQTVEAIRHAQAAKVPIIVAINKIDKPSASIDRIKEELTKYNLVSEEWGGDTMICKVSAKQNIGIEELLETILLQAEVLELTAQIDKMAIATIVEAYLDKGKGPVTNAIVREGTLKVGDSVVAGSSFGHVRAMFNDKGEPLESAGPSIAVSILGMHDVPDVGQTLNATKEEKTAKNIAEHFAMKQREEDLKKRATVSAENLFEHLKENEAKELKIIVKADVQGSVEAVKNILTRITNSEVKINVILASVGAIIENDINLSIASRALIIGFNVRPTAVALDLADKNGVQIRLYSIIYDIENDVKRLSVGLLDPLIKEVYLGKATVREVYNIPKVGIITGCIVSHGKISRDANVRLIRDNIVLSDDKIKSLKRFKDDAKEVKEGFECGIGLAKSIDIKVGDIIECYTLQEEERQYKEDNTNINGKR